MRAPQAGCGGAVDSARRSLTPADARGGRMLRHFRLVVVAFAIAAITVVPSASSRARHADVMCAVDSSGGGSTTTAPAPNTASSRRFGHRIISPGYTTCGSDDSQVRPARTGAYFADSGS